MMNAVVFGDSFECGNAITVLDLLALHLLKVASDTLEKEAGYSE